MTAARFYRRSDTALDFPRTSWLQFHDGGTYTAEMRTGTTETEDGFFIPTYEEVTGSWEILSAEPGDEPVIAIDWSEMRLNEANFALAPGTEKAPGDRSDKDPSQWLWELAEYPGEMECPRY